MKKFLSIFTVSILLSFSVSAEIKISGKIAKKMWKSVQLIQTILELDIIKDEVNVSSKYFNIDSVMCAYERYNACVFFTQINSDRKMVVAEDGTAKLMQAMAEAGIMNDDYHARIATKSILCKKSEDEYACYLEPFDNVRL